jgi:hypothetical protein
MRWPTTKLNSLIYAEVSMFTYFVCLRLYMINYELIQGHNLIVSEYCCKPVVFPSLLQTDPASSHSMQHKFPGHAAS